MRQEERNGGCFQKIARLAAQYDDLQRCCTFIIMTSTLDDSEKEKVRYERCTIVFVSQLPCSSLNVK